MLRYIVNTITVLLLLLSSCPGSAAEQHVAGHDSLPTFYALPCKGIKGCALELHLPFLQSLLYQSVVVTSLVQSNPVLESTNNVQQERERQRLRSTCASQPLLFCGCWESEKKWEQHDLPPIETKRKRLGRERERETLDVHVTN